MSAAAPCDAGCRQRCAAELLSALFLRSCLKSAVHAQSTWQHHEAAQSWSGSQQLQRLCAGIGSPTHGAPAPGGPAAACPRCGCRSFTRMYNLLGEATLAVLFTDFCENATLLWPAAAATVGGAAHCAKAGQLPSTGSHLRGACCPHQGCTVARSSNTPSRMMMM